MAHEGQPWPRIPARGWMVMAGEANANTPPVGTAATGARGVGLLRLGF